MLASLLLAVAGIGTSTARASPLSVINSVGPVDGSAVSAVSPAGPASHLDSSIANRDTPTRTTLDTAVSPLPTYANFSLSCESIALFAPDIQEDDYNKTKQKLPDQLRARCLDFAGRFHNTTIDLNLCVGIDYHDASLLWSVYGKYSEYCSACWAAGKGVEMACACMPLTEARPANTNSTLDLDRGIGNVNGTLYCTGGVGQKSEW